MASVYCLKVARVCSVHVNGFCLQSRYARVCVIYFIMPSQLGSTAYIAQSVTLIYVIGGLQGKDDQPLQVTIPEVQKQTNSVDCGCFAIAWAVLLAIGEKPEEVTLDKKQLRPHLLPGKDPFPHTMNVTFM